MENYYSRLVKIYFLEILVDSGNTIFLFSMTTSDCRTKILFVSDLLRLYVLIFFIDYLQFVVSVSCVQITFNLT